MIQEHGLGDYQILVQLPGVDDPARVKEIMQSTAMLEIRQAVSGPYPSEQAAMQANGGVLPPDTVLMKGTTLHAQNPEEASRGVLADQPLVGGERQRSALGRCRPRREWPSRCQFHSDGRRWTALRRLHRRARRRQAGGGARQPSEVGGHHPGADPRSRAASPAPSLREETQDLALTLRSGALPAGIKYLQEVTVGPSLGADSIREGVRAAIIGMVAVMIFMLFYYHAAGINADLGLILNLVILLGFLGFSGATLTLPGIAGVILTVGMGVDSNVLIFERIREELRHGKTPSSAVDQGFAHAWTTIIDTHVTTIVSAIILFLFGTGPVKGFAVTLSFGLAANLFTAVFVSRVIFEVILNRHQRGEAIEHLSVHYVLCKGLAVELFRNTNIDFLGKKWYFLAFSLIFSVAGICSMLFWHHIPLGVEFRGGTLVYVKFAQTPDLDQIRNDMNRAGLHDPRIQRFGPTSDNEVLVDLGIQETSEAALDQGKNTIIRALAGPKSGRRGKQDLNNTGAASLQQYLLQKDPLHLGTDAGRASTTPSPNRSRISATRSAAAF